jgi:hypothetical protein
MKGGQVVVQRVRGCPIVAMEISPVERERVEFRGEVLVCLFSQIICIYSQSDGSTSRGSL